MIEEAKLKAALLSIHEALVWARKMAFEADNKQLAEILDCLEVLPALIAQAEDQTELFFKLISGLSEEFHLPSIMQVVERNIEASG